MMFVPQSEDQKQTQASAIHVGICFGSWAQTVQHGKILAGHLDQIHQQYALCEHKRTTLQPTVPSHIGHMSTQMACSWSSIYKGCNWMHPSFGYLILLCTTKTHCVTEDKYKLEQVGDEVVLGSSSMQQYLPGLWSSSHTNYIHGRGYIIAKFSNIKSRHETR